MCWFHLEISKITFRYFHKQLEQKMNGLSAMICRKQYLQRMKYELPKLNFSNVQSFNSLLTYEHLSWVKKHRHRYPHTFTGISFIFNEYYTIARVNLIPKTICSSIKLRLTTKDTCTHKWCDSTVEKCSEQQWFWIESPLNQLKNVWFFKKYLCNAETLLLPN